MQAPDLATTALLLSREQAQPGKPGAQVALGSLCRAAYQEVVHVREAGAPSLLDDLLRWAEARLRQRDARQAVA